MPVRLGADLPLLGMNTNDRPPQYVTWPCIEVHLVWVDTIRDEAVTRYVDAFGWPDDYDEAEHTVLWLAQQIVARN